MDNDDGNFSMPYIDEHQQRVIGLIDEVFAAKLALVHVRNTLLAAKKLGGVVSTDLMAQPGIPLIDYINRQLKT